MGWSKFTKNKGHLPEKRAINFATVNQKKKHYGWAAAGSLLIVALAAGGSKYLVIDRMNTVFETQKKSAAVQKEIDETTELISSFADIKSDYEHNRISGLTEEELSYRNRLEILDILDRVVFTQASASSWTLIDNTLRIPVTSTSLQDINELIQQLEEEDCVAYCDLESAATNSDTQEEDLYDFFAMDDAGNGTITGNLVIYMDSRIPDQAKPFLTGGNKK